MTVDLGRAPLLQESVGLQRTLGQCGQAAAQIRNGGLNIHGTAQPELRRGADDTGLIGEKGPGDDVDVAACSLHGLSGDLAVLERDDCGVEKDVAPRGVGAALDGGAQLTIDESDGLRGLNGDVPAARLTGLRRDGAIIAEKLSAGVDGDVAGIGRAGAACGNASAVAHRR